MASPNLFLLSPSLDISRPLILRACPAAIDSDLWPRLHSDGSFHRRPSLPHHLVSILLGCKLVLIMFHKPQWSLRCDDHRLREEPDIYGMKIAVFAYHPLKTTLSNYLHSTHLDNISSFFFFNLWTHFSIRFLFI